MHGAVRHAQGTQAQDHLGGTHARPVGSRTRNWSSDTQSRERRTLSPEYRARCREQRDRSLFSRIHLSDSGTSFAE